MKTKELTETKELIAVGNSILRQKSKIKDIENKIFRCGVYAKITPIKDSADYFKRQGTKSKARLKVIKRQLFIFQIGYNLILNKQLS